MRKKEEVVRRRQGNGYGEALPALNVKWYPWGPDMLKYRHEGHEFSGDAPFFDWLERLTDDDPEDLLTSVEEIVREDGWEQAQELADDVWPNRVVKVWSDGRSDGWLVVEGLPEIDEWNAIMLAKWWRFAKGIAETVADLDYQFVWHAHVNCYETITEGFA